MRLPALRVLFLMLPLWSMQGQSAEALSVEELKSLQQKMKAATQLSVDFDQTKTNTLRPNKPSRSSGHAVFAKPAKFRWELVKPPGETLVFDGTTLYSLNTKEKIATKYNASADRYLDIKEVISVVLEFDSMQKKYNVSESTKEGPTITLKLKPKTPSTIDMIEVHIDNATAAIKGLKLIFGNKNTSEFSFSNPDRGILPPKTFDIPKDFKVVTGL